MNEPSAPAPPTEVTKRVQSDQDFVVLRLATGALGVLAILVVVMMGFLSLQERTLPDGVMAIGSAAVGALSTLLVRPMRNGS